MPTYVNAEKCDGCRALERPACMYICPMDLIKLDEDMGKSYNQEPDLCWECYACVKMCPHQAIEMRGYADVMPMGGMVQPLRGTQSILWNVLFRDGRVKQFRFPIRSTPWGSIDPHPDEAKPEENTLGSQALFGQERWLGVPDLPIATPPTGEVASAHSH